MTNPSTPGVLMRLSEPKQNASSNATHIPSQIPTLSASKTYSAVADDGDRPSRLNLYVLDDVMPLISSSGLYDTDVKSNPDHTISWVMCGFVSGLDKGVPSTARPSTHQPLSHTPIIGSKLVINGSSPRPGKELDYHEWYDVEHGPGLTTVPGWNAMRRYELLKTYGDIETARFYGFNYYDEESGLGGPIWQKATKTEWTFRIRGNASKPNIRRVWKIENA